MKDRCLWACAVCLPVVLAGGCVTPAPQPPVSLKELVNRPKAETAALRLRTIALHNVRRVLSTSLPGEQRIASMRVVETLAVEVPEAQAALAAVLADETAPQELRNDVLEFLAKRHHPGLARHVAEALPHAGDPGIRAAILQWLEENPSPTVLVEVVKLWAGHDKSDEADEQRYRRIVTVITGQPWEQALLERINDEAVFPRGSALAVLSRRVAPADLRKRVAALEARTPAVRAMQRMAEQFGTLPRNGQELLTLVVVLKKGPDRLSGAGALAWDWRRRHGYRFNIGDLHLLERMSADPLRDTKLSREQLVLEISRAIAGRRNGPKATGPEEFETQAAVLSMADLWNLFLLNESLSRRSTQLALRITASEDRVDRTTRFGGLVTYEHGMAAPTLYLPGARRGDDQYVPSRRFLSDAMSSLCFFVGHFRRGDALRVGPNRSELALAGRHNLHGVILTALPGDVLNATYFTPRGTRVDLGDFTVSK